MKRQRPRCHDMSVDVFGKVADSTWRLKEKEERMISTQRNG